MLKRSLPGLMTALSLLVASCGGGGGYAFAQLATSQAAVPTPARPSGAYYSPTTNLEQLDVAVIRLAVGNISMAAYALTDQAVVDALAERAVAGVKVRIYRDHGEVASECRGDVTCARAAWSKLMGMPNVEIRVKQSMVLMHLKGYDEGLPDGTSILREGSANFSPSGLTKQDNSAIFSTDPELGVKFAIAWRTAWDRPDNLTVAQAVQSAPAGRDWEREKPPATAQVPGQK